MTYQDTVSYLYERLPFFQRDGQKALKMDLSRTVAFLDHLGNPHKSFKSVHIAGTNGKGSCAHMMASVLHEHGYKTALYTSPHLKSFRERMSVNFGLIPEEKVISFVEQNKSKIEELSPSFFEVTVGMAFQWFAEMEVEYAVVETGIGGRLDSTNVILPVLSIITNVGYDHMDVLGDTLDKIAAEKAGIIKDDVPVVIGERHPETYTVFTEMAARHKAPCYCASDEWAIIDQEVRPGLKRMTYERNEQEYIYELSLLGHYQGFNLRTVLTGLQVMGLNIESKTTRKGLKKAGVSTGLKGRWQQLGSEPYIFCDTAHNPEGVEAVMGMFDFYEFNRLYIVWGMMADKDVDAILPLLPDDALFLLCAPDNPRSLAVDELATHFEDYDLEYQKFDSVDEALTKAKVYAEEEDLIFIGGSTFVVAEVKGL